MGEERMSEAYRIGGVVSDFVGRLTPAPGQYDSVAQALESLLPGSLRSHCRVGSMNNGSLRLVADGSSYLYELQLCKAVLLREMQHLCPSAKLRRIEVGMLR